MAISSTPQTPSLRPDLVRIAEQVRNLQRLSDSTGFKTSRSIGSLLEHLNPSDLAIVAQLVMDSKQ